MTEVEEGRRTALPARGGALFLIGMRVNRWWRPGRWLWILPAMGAMQRELAAERGRGLLHSRTLMGQGGITVVQYWRDADAVIDYAHDRLHRAAWLRYYRRAAQGGAVGIWHETYRLGTAPHEAVYVNMPAFGLGAATGTAAVTPATRQAADRLRASVPGADGGASGAPSTSARAGG